jgi:hypothetical protein
MSRLGHLAYLPRYETVEQLRRELIEEADFNAQFPILDELAPEPVLEAVYDSQILGVNL